MALRRETVVRAALLAAATASLGLLAAGGDAPQAPAAAPAVQRAQPAARTETLRSDLLNRSSHATTTRDAFAPHSWQPPAPPPAPPKAQAPPPPPPPEAPALPFTFLGSFDSSEGKPVYYLAEGERVLMVSEGETLNGVYRVVSVTAGSMVLVYLPLSIEQSLPFGGGK